MAKRPAEKAKTTPKKCRCPFCDVEIIFKEVPTVCQGCEVVLHLCPGCGKPVARDAKKCPDCGAKLS